MTYTYYYRNDGKVQCFSHVGYRPPFPGANCITYNGSDHYDALLIKKSCKLSTPPHLPNKDGNNDPQVPALPPLVSAEGYELKQPPELLFNINRPNELKTPTQVHDESLDAKPAAKINTAQDQNCISDDIN